MIFILIGNNLSHESAAILKKLEIESARIIIVKTDNNNKYERFARKNYLVTTTALYKFELTNLLPADLEKVLYLDGDIIAQRIWRQFLMRMLKMFTPVRLKTFMLN